MAHEDMSWKKPLAVGSWAAIQEGDTAIGAVVVTDVAEPFESTRDDGKTKYTTRIVSFEDTTTEIQDVVFTGHTLHYASTLVVGKVSRHMPLSKQS